MASNQVIKLFSIYLTFGIIAGYGMFAIQELDTKFDYPDFELFYFDMKEWQPQDITKEYTLHAKYAMAKAGVEVFHNYKVVPLMLSFGSMIISCMLAVQFSGKHVAAPITAFLLAVNNLFKFFDTSAVYDNSWTLFYLLALYFVGKKWQMTPLFFMLGILSKPIVILFAPSIIILAITTKQGMARKILPLVIGGIVIMPSLLTGYGQNYVGLEFDPAGFVSGLGDWFFFLFSDFYMLLLLPLTIIILGMNAKEKVPYALGVLGCMLNVALIGGPLEAFTNDIWNEPYRYVPLVCLFAAAFPLVLFNIKRKKKTITDSAFIKG